MKRSLSSLFVFIVLITGLISCGGSSSKTTNTSGLTFRAFISNPVNPSANGGGFPALDIIDATQDILSSFQVSLSGAVGSAGMMVESPKRDRTVVFSATGGFSSDSTLGIVNNASETASSSITLPGPTDSMFVWIDNNTLFAAIPTDPISGQSPGAVVQVSLPNSAITATIPVAGARYIVPSPSGNQILVISDSANSVSVLAPALISTGNALTAVATNPPTTFFDKPVWAVFSSDGSTAYVMNCGPECGGTGTTASIAVVDLTQPTPAVTSVVPVLGGATTGLLSAGNLYVAGTPSTATNCQTNLCGVLSVFPSGNLSSAPATFAITDGYHNNLVMAPNNQLFIGSHTCTNVIAAGSSLGRGCLSVFNTGGGTVYTAAQNGDVTGIQPILNRTVVYVCEGGVLTIYDTALDLGNQRQVQPQTTQVTIVGQAIDVKLADF